MDDDRTLEMVRLYTESLVPMATIARQYGLSRMGVWKVLNRAGIDTSKAGAAHLRAMCMHCGKPFIRRRCRVRSTVRQFCNRACYYAYVRTRLPGTLITRRHAGRLARQIVSKHFPLSHAQIVHHEDKNQENNSLGNLAVFNTTADHIRYHRGFNIAPVWKGASVV